MPASQRSATHLIAAQRSDEPQKPRSLDICREAWRDQHPAAARLMDDLSAKGVHLDPPRKPTVSDAVERAAATLGPAGALQVVLDAHSTDPHTSLGWFSNALYRAANGRPAAQATRGVQALPQNYAAEF